MSLPFINSPADIVRWLMIANGLGTDPDGWDDGDGSAWPIFNDTEPKTPDNCITTYDTAPRPDGTCMIDGESLTHYGFQVRIRSTDKPTGFTRAEMIRVAFNETIYMQRITVGAGRYIVHKINRGDIIHLGKGVPGSKRSLFTMNCYVTINRTS